MIKRKRILLRPLWMNLFFKYFVLTGNKYCMVLKPTLLMKMISKDGKLCKN